MPASLSNIGAARTRADMKLWARCGPNNMCTCCERSWRGSPNHLASLGRGRSINRHGSDAANEAEDATGLERHSTLHVAGNMGKNKQRP